MDKRIDIRADVIFDDVIILPVEGEITITENGVHDVASYETANVNVPTTNPEPLSVTENGTYTAPEGKAYSPVTVAVPEIELIPLEVNTNPYTAIAPEGKGFSPVSVNIPLGGTLDITENGGYSVVGYSGVNVMVPEIELIPLEVVSNGAVHVAPDGKGYSPVTVNIPLGGTLDITANGGYSVVGYSGVNVMVPETVLIPELNVSQNGTYTAPDGEAYSKVKVAVPEPSGSVWIRENTPYGFDVTDYATAYVEVNTQLEEEILWENPNPNDQIEDLTVQINDVDGERYKYIKINVLCTLDVWNRSPYWALDKYTNFFADPKDFYEVSDAKTYNTVVSNGYPNTTDAGGAILAARPVVVRFINNSGGKSISIYFGKCYSLGSSSNYNYACIPIKIIGIKQESQ